MAYSSIRSHIQGMSGQRELEIDFKLPSANSTATIPSFVCFEPKLVRWPSSGDQQSKPKHCQVHWNCSSTATTTMPIHDRQFADWLSDKDCDKPGTDIAKLPAAAEAGKDQQQYNQSQQDSPCHQQCSQQPSAAPPAQSLGLLSFRGVSGRTELHMAAELNDQAKVQHLLQAGADIHAVDSEGLTALMLAARAGHANTVRDLAAAGASFSKADSAGNTALLLAASSSSAGHAKTVLYLISKQADVKQANAAGHIPLMAAAAANNAGIVPWLLSSGAAVSTVNPAGYTALHIAAQCGFLNVAHQLLSYAETAYTND